MNDELLQSRLKKFTKEIGVPMTRVCREVNLSTVSIYRWFGGTQNLSDDAKKRIDNYLAKFNY